MKKEIKITPPEGFEIDKENSTFECIKFKPAQNKRWRDLTDVRINGFGIGQTSEILNWTGIYIPENYSTFATEKQAKSALAMARISQIMANDKRFGGVVTDEEWNSADLLKYVIARESGDISLYIYYTVYHFLAFHTRGQRDLFLKENEDLVRDYLMF